MKQFPSVGLVLFLFFVSSTAAADCAQTRLSAGLTAGDDIVAVCNKGSFCCEGDADDVTLYFQTEGKAAITTCKVAIVLFAVASGSLCAVKACRKGDRSTKISAGCRDAII